MTENYRWPFPKQPFPLWWKWSTSLAVGTVGTLSKIILCYLNSTKVHRKSVLLNAIHERPKGTSLVTVSNHHSCVDDPLLSGILPWRTFFSQTKIRWTPAAHDICFTKRWHGIFFALGKTVPIVRGEGVYQRGMDFTLEQMNRGEWAHIFPEGKVNIDKAWIRLKWGVGRLISECTNNPVVIPIYHIGLDDILPNRTPYIPRLGNKVTVLVGEPLTFQQQLESCKKLGHSALQMRKAVTDTIQEELDRLKAEAYKLHNSKSCSSEKI